MAARMPTSGKGINVDLVGLLAVAFTIYFVFDHIRTYHRLRQFKGPWLAATSRLWILKCLWNKDMHWELKRVCEEYGSVARIGPNDLVTDDADLLIKMSAVRSPYSKSETYSGTQFDPELNHVFSERDEARHLELRRKLTPGYSGRENIHLERSVDARILDLIQLVDREYLSKRSAMRQMDFAKIAQYFTLDVISDVAFGEPIGFLVRNEDVNGYCQVVEKALPAFEWAAALPMVNRLVRLPGLKKMVMPSPQDKSGVGMIMGLAKKIVSRRFGPQKVDRKDMLGSFLQHGLSQREAETEATLQIMAGSDTTVTALRATVLYIITNPQIYTRLKHELKTAQADSKISLPVVRDAEAQNLPYLLACIRESLRLWPPSFGLMQKVVPAEGDTIHGKFVPGGTRIGHCTWGVLRHKQVFGEDSHLYRPERWLEASEEKLTEMVRSADLLFGSGRYACLGKTVAFIELRKCLATIFARYDISLVDPTEPWKSVAANGMFLQSDMWVRFQQPVDESDFEEPRANGRIL